MAKPTWDALEQQSLPHADSINSDKPKWVPAKTLWPKTCVVSGDNIPMYTNAYWLKKQWPLEIDQWMTEEAFVFERLKGNV